MGITVGNTSITFNDATTQSTAASGASLRIDTFRTTTTWTCPVGVTRVLATVIGGGGGGGTGGASSPKPPGAPGGFGGVAIGYYTVVPGTAYVLTVGSGGAGTNGLSTGYAPSGTSSSFSSFCSATGATGGFLDGTANYPAAAVDGVGSNGNLSNRNSGVVANLFTAGLTRPSGGQAATAFPAIPTVFSPGAGGRGNDGYNTGASTGGVGGVISLEYVS